MKINIWLLLLVSCVFGVGLFAELTPQALVMELEPAYESSVDVTEPVIATLTFKAVESELQQYTISQSYCALVPTVQRFQEVSLLRCIDGVLRPVTILQSAGHLGRKLH